MIKEIHIKNTATYGNNPEKLSRLKKVNFVFGSNGTGKTTISRIIANSEKFPSCSVIWENNENIQAMVYNRDFIEENFETSTELKGILTLGKGNIEVINEINSTKTKIDDIVEEIRTLTVTRDGDVNNGKIGKRGELAKIEEEFKQVCWKQKQKYDDRFKDAFSGLRNSTEKFKQKIIEQSNSNKRELKSLKYLEDTASIIFGTPPNLQPPLSKIVTENLRTHESNPILEKPVIGKSDVDIAAMITKLDNIDWVRKGREYFIVNKDICPFCQQVTPDSFSTSLNDYFDETFERDVKIINELKSGYIEETQKMKDRLQYIIEIENIERFVDIQKFDKQKSSIDSKILNNRLAIYGKEQEPSRVVQIETLTNDLDIINEIIDESNRKIEVHNDNVRNISEKRQELIGEVWKYLIGVELKDNLRGYLSQKNAIQQAIDNITQKISDLEIKKHELNRTLEELERQTVSVQPTINAINDILSSFGFNSFSLGQQGNESFYKIVRPDGSDAKKSLSEGEKSLVTFLYFYHLISGSNSEVGINTNRIVVFDDPVSSLDSDCLFIVSSLIKQLIAEIRESRNNLKQVFIMTHNVYFHKEVTFVSQNESSANRTFWIVRKLDVESTIQGYNESNPIQSSYQIFWDNVRNFIQTDNLELSCANLTIQNTLRRIIENYFKIFGSVDYDSICLQFDSEERIACRSLFYWINAGSHDIQDDLYVHQGSEQISMYLNVFKKIFDKTGHIAHYNMMMGNSNEYIRFKS